MKDLRDGVLVDLTPEEVATIEADQAALAAAVPAKISKMQARLALWGAGQTAAVDAAVQARGPATVIYWTEVSEVHRSHPLVVDILCGDLGWASEYVDELFRVGAQIF